MLTRNSWAEKQRSLRSRLASGSFCIEHTTLQPEQTSLTSLGRLHAAREARVSRQGRMLLVQLAIAPWSLIPLACAELEWRPSAPQPRIFRDCFLSLHELENLLSEQII